MDSNDKNNLIILNGPTRGLGIALVSEILKDSRYHIICLVRDLKATQELSKFKKNVEIVQCNYRNISEVNEIDNLFTKRFSRKLNDVCFINNLSVITPIGKIGSLLNDDIANSITINMLSNTMIINSFLKRARAKKHVSILNISSGISKKPVAGLGLYGLSKNFIEYISSVIREENFNNNVRVTSFYPGGMRTNMQKTLQKELREKEELHPFDYSAIFTQEVRETRKIAEVILANFFKSDKGWNKLISKVYQYEEQ